MDFWKAVIISMLLAVLLATAHMGYKHESHWDRYDDPGYEATMGH